MERDRIEANINSISYLEFHKYMNYVVDYTEKAVAEHEMRLKEDLLKLAQYERHGADMAAERLLKELKGIGEKGRDRRKKREKVDAIRLSIGVTRLYADLYVARDLSNPVTS